MRDSRRCAAGDTYLSSKQNRNHMEAPNSEGEAVSWAEADEGISGLNTRRREGFNGMVEDALSGRIDLIVTKSVSRFSRNTVDSLVTIRKLKDAGCECFFEKEGIFTFDSKGELLLTIMSSLAQEESRSISENVTWGQRKRFADGKVSMPYKHFLGFEKGPDGQPKIVPEQAELVRRIYAAFNRLIPDRERLLDDCRLMQDALTDCAELDAEKAEQLREMEIIFELTRRCVEDNSRSAQDQEAYLEQYNGYVARYESAKSRLDALEQKRSERKAKAEAIGGFMFELRERAEPLVSFDRRLWMDALDTATVYRDGRIVFKFQNGVEVEG